MKLKYLFFFLLIGSGAYAYADDPLIELFKKNIIKPYESFFKQKRERVYVHLNRSEYLAGDNIWFKAYIYDPKAKQLMIETNKLYAELFDQSGKLMERKTLFVTNGLANSFFKLDQKLKNGIYTIRAYTNWMRNFNDQPIYSQEFRIRAIGSSTPVATSSSAEILPAADLQVFPEGGMFVEGIDNHFGVKLTMPNGQGTASKGYVIGPKNDTLETFTTNHLGFGDFTIYDAKKFKYKIAIEYESIKHKEITISEPLEKGIGMIVNTLLPSKIIVAINMNLQTATGLKDQDIIMAVHNNGIVYKSSYFRTTEDGFITIINKSLLGPGVNHITIFGSDFKPLAERLIFNNSNIVRGIVDIKHCLQKDSLSIEVCTTDRDNIGKTASLSFSILPAKTGGNNFSNSLHTDLLLNSSIKGNIESSNYYTESDDLKHQKDLDNLLLTQGWRRYEWPDILTNKIPAETYPFEKGFTIDASAENLFKGKGEKNSIISLFSPKNSLLLVGNVDETGNVSFTDLHLSDSSHVILSAANLKGAGSNRNLKASVNYPSFDSTITLSKSYLEKNPIADTDLSTPLTEELIELKEVVISAKKEANPFDNDPYYSINDKFYVITKENYYKYYSLESLLNSEFFIQATRNSMNDLNISMGRGQRSLFGSNSPAVIIDGIQCDLSFLSMISIYDIEAIAVNKSGSVMAQGNGSINIITRKSAIDWGESGYSRKRLLLVNGYAKNAEFFTPKYVLSPESESYQKHASIYWNPDVTTDSTGKAYLNFAIPKELKEFTIRAEGMSQSGTVYYYDRRITVRSEL